MKKEIYITGNVSDKDLTVWEGNRVEVHRIDYANLTVLEGKVVAAFDSDFFLRHLTLILNFGRPAKIIWIQESSTVNDVLIDAHKRGWIQAFGFRSEKIKDEVYPQLESTRKTILLNDWKFLDSTNLIERWKPWRSVFAGG